ncbi:hypothetical protein ACJJI5_11110 [Microbulbifer sp. EKSA008]|uniref:hypothetical protein n=1 Tax=Microbulbifer sp. EKSA008 TaxID=3243367 RepID=UPI0040436B07
MSHSLNIINFLNTGNFLGLAVGASKQDVLTILGVPTGWARSDTKDKIETYRNANMWGYGPWVFYFDGDILDAITGNFGFRELEFSDFSEVSGWGVEEFKQALEEEGIDFYVAPKKLCFIDLDGSKHERRRRLAYETLFVGKDLNGRVYFDDSSVSQVAYPCSPVAQVVGKKINAKAAEKGWRLVR